MEISSIIIVLIGVCVVVFTVAAMSREPFVGRGPYEYHPGYDDVVDDISTDKDCD